jgi:hypothetical protein
MAGLVPAIHVLAFARGKAWMPGTSPGMTIVRSCITFSPSPLVGEGGAIERSEIVPGEGE